MITRVRIEARGSTEDEVKDELINGLMFVRQGISDNSDWEITDEAVQTTLDGHWGFTVMKRMDDAD